MSLKEWLLLKSHRGQQLTWAPLKLPGSIIARIWSGFTKLWEALFPCSSESTANASHSSNSLLRTGLNRYLHWKSVESCLSKRTQPLDLSEDTCSEDGYELRYFLQLPKPWYEHFFFITWKRSATIRHSSFALMYFHRMRTQQLPP